MVYACKVKGLEEVEKLGRLLEMNVLCIFDQDHQWLMIAVDHTSKFEVYNLVYNNGNEALLQKLTDKSQISGKR